MDITLPLDSFNGVGEGKRASVSIPGGPTIDEIELIYPYSVTAGAEFTAAHFTTVRFKLGTEAIVEVTGEELIKLCQDYLGIYTENGRIVIPFKEIAARTYDGVHMTGLVTFPSDAITVEAEINGTGASAVLALSGRATYSASQPVRKIVPKILAQSFPVTATGEIDVTTLARGPRVKRIHFADAEMAALRILRDKVEVYNAEIADAEFTAKRHGRVPQTGYFHLDSSPDGFSVAKMLVTASGSLVLKPRWDTLTAPTQCRMVIESVEAVDAGMSTRDVSAAAVDKGSKRPRRIRRRR